MNAKSLLSYAFLFVFAISTTKAQDNLSLKIHNCRSAMLYIIRNDSLIFPNNIYNDLELGDFNLKLPLDAKDAMALRTDIRRMLETRYNEVLDNYCVNDGWHYKLLIQSDRTSPKKIYLSNFYYPTFNRIALIINSYLEHKFNSLSVSLFTITEEDAIESEIISLGLCGHEFTEEEKDNLLNSWCEPPSWESNNAEDLPGGKR